MKYKFQNRHFRNRPCSKNPRACVSGFLPKIKYYSQLSPHATPILSRRRYLLLTSDGDFASMMFIVTYVTLIINRQTASDIIVIIPYLPINIRRIHSRIRNSYNKRANGVGYKRHHLTRVTRVSFPIRLSS